MINVKYYAAEKDDLYSLQDNSEEAPPISSGTLYDIQNKIKDSTPIFNYASFFGNGIDLYDESIEFGNEADYYGFILPPTQDEQIIKVSLYDIEAIENGITIVFNKYTCGKIVIEKNGEILGSAEAESGKLLPEKVHIDFILSNAGWSDINIIFSQFDSNTPINIQGIILGKVIDIDDITSFDMISETNPISDDLAINETNISAVIPSDFYSEEGQKMKIFDNDNLLENNVLKSAEETDVDLYNIKSRSVLEDMDKIQADYFNMGFGINTDVDYNTYFRTVGEVLTAAGINVKIPEEVANQYVSQYLKPSSKRKILQQVAWALCCGIDTTNSDIPVLIPFFASDTVTPDIVINNSDDRILKTSIKNDTKYSKIIWKRAEYLKNDEFEIINSISLLRTDEINGKTFEYTTDEPISVFTDARDFNATNISPYKHTVYILPNPQYNGLTFGGAVKGYKYLKKEESVEILLDNKNGETLEISNQAIFPVVKNSTTGLSEFDGSKKLAQLKKWYSNNNTLSATVVDDNSEIKVGKVVKIQLKKGNYFQGIVTKVVRNNIGTYHTVDLEAHEWN